MIMFGRNILVIVDAAHEMLHFQMNKLAMPPENRKVIPKALYAHYSVAEINKVHKAVEQPRREPHYLEGRERRKIREEKSEKRRKTRKRKRRKNEKEKRKMEDKTKREENSTVGNTSTLKQLLKQYTFF